ncbi:unnamed protein product [Vitrella brassicaformis CCMP3155]|uniref:PNK FHA domain-containing protein n=1 Tax=Vitrella brassicaformis (strain CCMP3155) TaxID=1169540 RepID=A0A0G4EWC3_VITBC|nr:unnamed protein product [Vitrella brassicaformis CCMP3155]|eukprot:CEM03257.1 unnamed protein product [Vitrella brassicaformis CCMP3155]
MEQRGSVYWKDYDSPASDKVLGLDLDGTLIAPKSGAKWPKDANDWRLLYGGSCRTVLKKHVNDGFKVVVFSNQKGVSTGKQKLEDLQKKLDAVQAALAVPMLVYLATRDDIYRKPCTGSWDLMESEHNDGVKIDRKQSKFVGDAAGRPASGGRKKDFSSSDHKFALNLGIRFLTPEEAFLGQNSNFPTTFDFDPRTLGQGLVPPSTVIKKVEDTEVVILVGAPGSGKSSLVRKLFPTYKHVNQDTLKDKNKCVKECKTALAAGQSAVIDNQNKDKSTRKAYIDLAKQYKAKVRAVYMDVPKDLCFHLNAYRELNPRVREHKKKIPPMVLHSFYKNREVPQKSEGIDEVITLTIKNFEPGPFADPSDEKLLKSFLE